MDQGNKHNKVCFSLLFSKYLKKMKIVTLLYYKLEGKKKTKKAKGSKKQGKDELFKSLKTKIGITREEFDKSHKEFQTLCPKGQMTKEQFLEKSKETLAAGPMAGALFRVFDEDDR